MGSPPPPSPDIAGNRHSRTHKEIEKTKEQSKENNRHSDVSDNQGFVVRDQFYRTPFNRVSDSSRTRRRASNVRKSADQGSGWGP